MALRLKVTESISELLEQARSSSAVPQDVREEASASLKSGAVGWGTLKQASQALRAAGGMADGGPWLHRVCEGSAVVLDSPPPRQRSTQLEARLEKLREDLDNKNYKKMVADITRAEDAAEAMRGLLPNTRLQLSFGMHVIVTMGTFFALGYFGARMAFKSQYAAAIGGALGLTFGMLMETVLLIIRTNRPDVSVDEKYAHLLDPKIWDAKGDLKQKAAAAAAAQRSGGSATAEPRRPPPPKPQESKKQK